MNVPGFKKNMFGEETFTMDVRSIEEVKKQRQGLDAGSPKNVEHAIDILRNLQADAIFVDENSEASKKLRSVIWYLEDQIKTRDE